MVNPLIAISKPSILLLLLFFLITSLQPNHISAQSPTKPTYFIEVCRPAFGNYTTNNTYERNLNKVLFHLQNVSSSSLSANYTAGKVHGQYNCRGDIDTHLCHDCINEAAQSIKKNCSFSKAAIIWYEECTLQYGNLTAVAAGAEFPRSWWHSDKNVSDTANFGATLNTTVDRIINESKYTNGSLHFATGEGVVSPVVTAYCLVQCSPELNETQCETCLRSAYGYVPTCCGKWAEWVFVFFPSCQLRYSTDPFYALPPSLPPPVKPPPPPPVVTGGSPTVRIEESVKLGLLGAAVAFLMFRETA